MGLSGVEREGAMALLARWVMVEEDPPPDLVVAARGRLADEDDLPILIGFERSGCDFLVTRDRGFRERVLFSAPRTCGAVPVKSAVRVSPSTVSVTWSRTGGPPTPSLSIQSVKVEVPSGQEAISARTSAARGRRVVAGADSTDRTAYRAPRPSSTFRNLGSAASEARSTAFASRGPALESSTGTIPVRSEIPFRSGAGSRHSIHATYSPRLGSEESTSNRSRRYRRAIPRASRRTVSGSLNGPRRRTRTKRATTGGRTERDCSTSTDSLCRKNRALRIPRSSRSAKVTVSSTRRMVPVDL